eukprot:g2995.t1
MSTSAHRTPQRCGAFPAMPPYLLLNSFQGRWAVKQKRELPELPLASPSSLVLPHNIHVLDRLTHVQLLFTWNLSPLQSSKFSFEYLLLPPRSALGAVSAGLTP